MSDPSGTASGYRRKKFLKSQPFGLPKTPFDPFTGRFAALDPYSNTVVKEFVVEDITYDDYIRCIEQGLAGTPDEAIDDIDENTVYFCVAKAYHLRRTPFDGKTVNSVTYTYSSPQGRQAVASGSNDETQLITPSYYVGDVILALYRDTRIQDEDDAFIEWEEILPHRFWGVEV